MLLLKLSTDLQEHFEVEHRAVELPTYKQLQTFVENHAKALEAVNISTGFFEIFFN